MPQQLFQRTQTLRMIGGARVAPNYNLQLVRGRGNNTWVFPFMTGAAFVGLSMYALCKNLGFLSDWGRVKYLVAGGEYRQLLEPGTAPENLHLPPHLRLDMVSYMDGEEVRIAEAPMYDLSVSESDMLMSLYDTMRDDQKVAYDFVLGGCLAMTSMAMPHYNVERVVSRRMTLAEHNNKNGEGGGEGLSGGDGAGVGGGLDIGGSSSTSSSSLIDGEGSGKQNELLDKLQGLSEEERRMVVELRRMAAEKEEEELRQHQQQPHSTLPAGVSVVETIRDRKTHDSKTRWW